MQEKFVMTSLSLRSCNATQAIERNCHTCISNRTFSITQRK